MSSISIALTTYNGGKYLRLQLDSLLTQTLPFDEIVICDDKSSDDTFNILQEYSRKDNRFRVILNETTLGFKKNFEKALSLCSGDYIALCDQDDIWLPNHLESLYNGIGNHVLACGASEIIDSKGVKQNIKLHDINNFTKTHNNNASIFRFVSFYQNPFQGASMLLRRDFLGKVLPIPSNVLYHDVWFAINACLSDSFVFINEPVTLYRLHSSNASGSHKHKSVIRTIAGHFLKESLNNNRSEIFNAIKQSEYAPRDSFVLVKQALKYYKDRSLRTRFENMIFELMNYKSIYGKK